MSGSGETLPTAGAEDRDPVAGFSFDDLLEELAGEYAYPEVEPDEITARMLARRLGCGWDRAHNILERKVAAGEYTSRRARQGQHNTTAYRKVSP